jgi:hypothetical protein
MLAFFNWLITKLYKSLVTPMSPVVVVDDISDADQCCNVHKQHGM